MPFRLNTAPGARLAGCSELVWELALCISKRMVHSPHTSSSGDECNWASFCRRSLLFCINKGKDAIVVLVLKGGQCSVEVGECQWGALQQLNSVEMGWKGMVSRSDGCLGQITVGADCGTLEIQCFRVVSKIELCGSCCDELAPRSYPLFWEIIRMYWGVNNPFL